ncbi:hypothetical protein ACLOJK_024378 [Asimina triloba]
MVRLWVSQTARPRDEQQHRFDDSPGVWGDLNRSYTKNMRVVPLFCHDRIASPPPFSRATCKISFE